MLGYTASTATKTPESGTPYSHASISTDNCTTYLYIDQNAVKIHLGPVHMGKSCRDKTFRQVYKRDLALL